MISNIIVHDLLNKERKFVLKDGAEFSATAEETDNRIINISAKVKTDVLLSIEGFSVRCDGVAVKTSSKECQLAKGDILLLRYSIHVPRI